MILWRKSGGVENSLINQKNGQNKLKEWSKDWKKWSD